MILRDNCWNNYSGKVKELLINATEDKPSESSKKLDANEVVEIMKRAVKRELNRKSELRQYAIICENGEVKKIQL